MADDYFRQNATQPSPQQHLSKSAHIARSASFFVAKAMVVVVIGMFRCLGMKKRLDPLLKAEANLRLRMPCSSEEGVSTEY